VEEEKEKEEESDLGMDVDFKVASPKGAYFNLGTNQMN
jgi:hypothetical protein